jgi:hypothetical protein
MREGIKPFNVYLEEGHRGSVYCRNSRTPFVEDGVICAGDNIIFIPGAIERALSIFNENFPYDDGVYAFNFEGIGSCTALVLVGQKFLQRYPKKFLFYPGYFHLACQEISELCRRLEKVYGRKFLIIDEVKTVVHHRLRDLSYRDARKYRREDLKLKIKREEKGLVWGMKIENHYDA